MGSFLFPVAQTPLDITKAFDYPAMEHWGSQSGGYQQGHSKPHTNSLESYMLFSMRRATGTILTSFKEVSLSCVSALSQMSLL